MSAVTLKDIANAAGVSTTTVSIILNGKAPHISEETKKLVLQKAKELHYRPNKIARMLVTKSSRSIGLILPDIVNPFFAEIAKGVYDEAMKRRYTVSTFNTDDDADKDMEYIDFLTDNFTDGIIAVFSTDQRSGKEEQYAQKLKALACPVVLIDRMIEGYDFLSVKTDNQFGAALGTAHLLEQGHKKIGCITSHLGSCIAKERFYGYLQTLQKHHVFFNPELIVEGDFRFETGYKGAFELVQKGATAIFAFNDMIAYGIYRAAQEMELKIPRDLSVVGYDDLLYSSMLNPPLTTIHQPARKIGQESAKKLIRALEGRLEESDKHAVFPPKLVARESTRIYAADQKAENPSILME